MLAFRAESRLFVRNAPGNRSLELKILTIAFIALIAANFPALAQAAKPAQGPKPAAAVAAPVFPPASRIGIAPPKGMVLSGKFPGFEDEKAEAAIFLTELSRESYDGASGTLTAEALAQQGIKIIRRDAPKEGEKKRLIVRGEQSANGKSFERWFMVDGESDITVLVAVQLPKAATRTYTEKTIRDALATLSVRPKLSQEELLSAMPFKLGELSGFRISRVMAGSSAVLTDGDKDAPEPHEQPVVIIARAPIAPPPEENRDPYARRVFAETRAAGQLVIERAGPVKLGENSGHEIIAAGRDPDSKQDLFAMQSFRFGKDNFIRILAIGPARDREALEKRFSAIRDSIADK